MSFGIFGTIMGYGAEYGLRIIFHYRQFEKE